LDEESAGRSRPRQALANLRNHREAIAAMDFFTVQTITFGVLQCFSRTARFGPLAEVLANYGIKRTTRFIEEW
jgi:hypothetical protein